MFFTHGGDGLLQLVGLHGSTVVPVVRCEGCLPAVQNLAQFPELSEAHGPRPVRLWLQPVKDPFSPGGAAHKTTLTTLKNKGTEEVVLPAPSSGNESNYTNTVDVLMMPQAFSILTVLFCQVEPNDLPHFNVGAQPDHMSAERI